jgi:Protein of unknown function, DUF488
MKTSSWFTQLPAGHVRIGISRSTPRRIEAGYRILRELAPGPWFKSCTPREYCRLYSAEILAALDPQEIAARMMAKAEGRVPVLVCFEQAGKPGWCHRALAAEWLAAALGHPVPELGFEHLPQDQHPLAPPIPRPWLR